MATVVEVAVELGKRLETDSDPMRSLLGRMLRLVMEAEALCGADYGERSEDRTTHRKGYRQQVLETRVGTIDLAIRRGPLASDG